jgi:hypothetical protein
LLDVGSADWSLDLVVVWLSLRVDYLWLETVWQVVFQVTLLKK